MATERISWQDLACPTEPGEVKVSGRGIVDVKQKNIDTAKEHDNELEFELIDASGPMDKVPIHRLGRAFPL